MAIRGKIDPVAAELRISGRINAKGGIDDVLFVRVDKGEDLIRSPATGFSHSAAGAEVDATVEPEIQVEAARPRNGPGWNVIGIIHRMIARAAVYLYGLVVA